MNKNIIVVNNLTKKYKISDKFALNGIDLKIRKGSIFGLLGPNGCGKSTTMGLILGLVSPTQGKITVFDQDIKKHRSKILQKMKLVLYQYLLTTQ